MRYRQAVYPQLTIILFIFAFVIAVAFWQIDFVIEGAMSNIYLNGAIFVGIFLGVLLQVANLTALRAEFTALDALYEAHDDARRHASPAISDERETALRAQRMGESATVFHAPAMLGSAFKLLYGQLMRDGLARIPAATAKTLIDDLEGRIADRISFQNYVAGLMVLLGLLGTFIGLLGTVGSVGDIIASIDLSGGASVDAIQALLEKLEAPLAGMATGFSSSLFGLIGSLMLGMMTKVSGRANNALRRDFENWINRVSQLESIGGAATVRDDADEDEDGAPLDGGAPFHANPRLLLRVARSTLAASAQLTRQIDGLRGHMVLLTEETVASRARLDQLSAKFSRMIDVQEATLTRSEQAIDVSRTETDRLIDALRDVATTLERAQRDAGEKTVHGVHAAFDQFDRRQERRASERRLTDEALQERTQGLADELSALRTAFRETEETTRAAEIDHRLITALDALIAEARLSEDELARLKRLVSTDAVTEPESRAEIEKWITALADDAAREGEARTFDAPQAAPRRSVEEG